MYPCTVDLFIMSLLIQSCHKILFLGIYERTCVLAHGQNTCEGKMIFIGYILSYFVNILLKWSSKNKYKVELQHTTSGTLNKWSMGIKVDLLILEALFPTECLKHFFFNFHCFKLKWNALKPCHNEFLGFENVTCLRTRNWKQRNPFSGFRSSSLLPMNKEWSSPIVETYKLYT